MTKNELIREASDILSMVAPSSAYERRLFEAIRNMRNMLSTAIVWQDGEPPAGEYRLLYWGDKKDWHTFQVCYVKNDGSVEDIDGNRIDIPHDKYAILTPPQEEQCCACFGENS